jgi:hypothetical protein
MRIRIQAKDLPPIVGELVATYPKESTTYNL